MERDGPGPRHGVSPLSCVVPLEPLRIHHGGIKDEAAEDETDPSRSSRNNNNDDDKTHPPTQAALKRSIEQSVAQLIEESVSFHNTDRCPVTFPITPLLGGDNSEALPSLRAMLDDPTNAMDPTTTNRFTTTGKRLDPEQRRQLKTTGQFRVVADYDDDHHHDQVLREQDYHVWQVAAWFIQGQQPMVRHWRQCLARAVRHLCVQWPRRWYGSSLSCAKGLHELARAIYGLWSLWIGGVERVSKYASAMDLEQQVARCENDHVIQFLGPNHSLLPVFDNQQLEQTEPMTESLRNEAFREQSQPEFQRLWLQRMQEDAAHPQGRNSADDWERALEAKHFERWSELILTSPKIEACAPGIGRLLVNRMKLDRLVRAAEAASLADLETEREQQRARLTERHPILALVDEWMDEQLAQHCQKLERGICQKHFDSIPTQAVEHGIGDFGVLYEQCIRPFRENQAHALRDMLSRETVVAKEFIIRGRIWQPRNWKRIEVKTEQGATRFMAQKYRHYRVATDFLFWRWCIAFHSCHCGIFNGLYRIVHFVWDGPLGLRSLFGAHDFVSEYMMDEWSGEVVADESSLTPTLRSRLKRIWQHVAHLRRDFESLPDTGLIGKAFSRLLNVLSSYVGIGIPATLLLLLGQPLLTIALCLLAIIAALTSPVWSLCAVLLTHLVDKFIYDRYATDGICSGGPWFPSLVLIWRIVTSCLLRIVLALTCSVAHLTISVFWINFGAARFLARYTLDMLFYKLVIKPFGRVPGHDSFLAWRIAGPGITQQYACYLIPTDIALLALRAKLQAIEIDLFAEYAEAIIRDPITSYHSALDMLLRFGLSVSALSGSDAGLLVSRQDAQLRDLHARLERRRETYREKWDVRPLVVSPQINEIRPGEKLLWIKQNQDQLDNTLTQGAIIISDIWEMFEKRYTSKEINMFWFVHEIVPGDFVALTKKLFAQVFSDDFLVPLEECDRDRMLPIRPSNVDDLLRALI